LAEATAHTVRLIHITPVADTGGYAPLSLFSYRPYASYIVLQPTVSIARAREVVRSAELNEARGLANAFADRLRRASDVAELWLVRESGPLTLAVIVSAPSLDRDLELRAMFAELTVNLDAEMLVYAQNDSRAELGRRGERLIG
jgi:hypothetical protein